MGQVTIGKWGNNLALRLPGDIIRAADIRDGEQVDVSMANGEIVIRRIESPALETLFQGKMPSEWRAAYADAFDWGPDVGREIVPE